MDRAWQLISKGDGVRALLAARQALAINAESPEVHNLLGCIYAMDGDFEEALSCYEKASWRRRPKAAPLSRSG